MFKWLGILTIAGILAVMGIQLVPVYIQNYTVKKVAQEVASDVELQKSPKREVRNRLAQLFNSHDINSLDPKEIVTVDRDNTGQWVLGVKYEERRKLLYNLEIVAAFDDQITN